jgi:hypothetical protein
MGLEPDLLLSLSQREMKTAGRAEFGSSRPPVPFRYRPSSQARYECARACAVMLRRHAAPNELQRARSGPSRTSASNHGSDPAHWLPAANFIARAASVAWQCGQPAELPAPRW